MGVSLRKVKISPLANMLGRMRSGLTLRATLMAAAIFFAFMPSASQADVSPTKPSVDAAFGDKIARAAAEVPSIGSGFSESYPTPDFSLSALRGSIPVAAGKQGQGDHPLCASATDPHCANVHIIKADLIIPPCYSDADRICVEGLEVGAEGKPLEKAVLDHELKTNKTPADAKLGLPAGGSASIWNAPSLSHQGNALSYAVIVTQGYKLDKKIAASSQKFEPWSFNATVIPVNMKKGKYCGFEIFEIEKDSYFGEVNTSSRMAGDGCDFNIPYRECILTEQGFCAAPAQFLPNTRVALTLRMDSKVTGWLFGRMKDVDVAITSLDANNNKLRVEATSVNLLSGTGWVAKKDLIKYSDLYELEKKRWFSGDGKFEDYLAAPGRRWGDMSVGDFDTFKAWEQLIKPNPEDNWRWNFGSNIDKSKRNCEGQTGTDKLIGLVTTNAPIYASGAPAFTDGSLSYKVAGLHFKADGTLFKGSYDLAIRSDFARCLYGFSNAPIRASVSVLSSDGSTQNVATELVTEKNGWMTLSAKNFTFSAPTIKVKLVQDNPVSTTPSQSDKPVSTAPSEQAAPVTKTMIKVKIINCVKGKTTKKVSGSNPKCPTGYKQR